MQTNSSLVGFRHHHVVTGGILRSISHGNHLEVQHSLAKNTFVRCQLVLGATVGVRDAQLRPSPVLGDSQLGTAKGHAR